MLFRKRTTVEHDIYGLQNGQHYLIEVERGKISYREIVKLANGLEEAGIRVSFVFTENGKAIRLVTPQKLVHRLDKNARLSVLIAGYIRICVGSFGIGGILSMNSIGYAAAVVLGFCAFTTIVVGVANVMDY